MLMKLCLITSLGVGHLWSSSWTWSLGEGIGRATLGYEVMRWVFCVGQRSEDVEDGLGLHMARYYKTQKCYILMGIYIYKEELELRVLERICVQQS